MGTIDIDYGSLGIGLLLMLIPVYFLWHFMKMREIKSVSLNRPAAIATQTETGEFDGIYLPYNLSLIHISLSMRRMPVVSASANAFATPSSTAKAK